MKLIDLTGKRFGRLTVIKRAKDYISPSGSMSVMWLCRCDCGNYITTYGSSLKSGETSSCGCFRSETHFNDYYIKDNVAYIICKNGEIIVDAEDISKLKEYRWIIGKNGYAYSCDKKIMHRIILDAKKNEIIDHINHDKLDNRKSNLRKVDYSINGFNKAFKPGKSGEPFISYSKTSKYYSVYVDKIYCGGSYDLEKAIEIRNEALVGSKVEQYNPFVKELLKKEQSIL